MNNNLQQSNMKFAQLLASRLQRVSNIETIILYGSIGKGYSDERSDVDLVLIASVDHVSIPSSFNSVNELLDEGELVFKEQELSVLQFDSYPSLDQHKGLYPSFRTSLVISHNNRLVDTTIRIISREVVNLLVKNATGDVSAYQTLIQYVGDTKVLFDSSNTFESWRQNICSFRVFAPDLYRRFIGHCLSRFNYYVNGEIPDSVYRGDAIVRTVELSKAIILFLNMLYAINNQCLPYPKWEHCDIDRLMIKPVDTHIRLLQVIKDQDPVQLAKLGGELTSILKSVV